MSRRSVGLSPPPQAGLTAILNIDDDTFALRVVGDVTKNFLALIEGANSFRKTAQKFLDGHQAQVLSQDETLMLDTVVKAIEGDLKAVKLLLQPALVASSDVRLKEVRYKTLKEGRQVVALHSRLASTHDNINAVMKQLTTKNKTKDSQHQSNRTSVSVHGEGSVSGQQTPQDQLARQGSRPVANERRHRKSGQSSASIATSISSCTILEDPREQASTSPINLERADRSSRRTSLSVDASNFEASTRDDQSERTSTLNDAVHDTGRSQQSHVNELEADTQEKASLACQTCALVADVPQATKADGQPEMTNMLQVNADDHSSSTDFAQRCAEHRRRQQAARERQRQSPYSQTQDPLLTAQGLVCPPQPDDQHVGDRAADSENSIRYPLPASTWDQKQRDSGYHSPDLSKQHSPTSIHKTSTWVSPNRYLIVDIPDTAGELKRSDTLSKFYTDNPLSEEDSQQQSQKAASEESKQAPPGRLTTESRAPSAPESKSFQIEVDQYVGNQNYHHVRAASDPQIPTLKILPSTPTTHNDPASQFNITRNRSMVTRKPLPMLPSIDNKRTLLDTPIREEDPASDMYKPVATASPPQQDPQGPKMQQQKPAHPFWMKPEHFQNRQPGVDRTPMSAPLPSVAEHGSDQNVDKPEIHMPRPRKDPSGPSEPLRRALIQQAHKEQLRNATEESARQNIYLERARKARLQYAAKAGLSPPPNISLPGSLSVPEPDKGGRVSPLTPEQRHDSTNHSVAVEDAHTPRSVPTGGSNSRHKTLLSQGSHEAGHQSSEDDSDNPMIEDAREAPTMRLAQLNLHSAPFTQSQTKFTYEPQRHDPQRHEPQRHDPHRHEPQRHEPQRHEPQRHEPRRHEAQRHEAQRHEAQRHGAQQHEPQRHEAQRHDPHRHDPQRHEPQRPEQQRQQAPRSRFRSMADEKPSVKADQPTSTEQKSARHTAPQIATNLRAKLRIRPIMPPDRLDTSEPVTAVQSPVTATATSPPSRVLSPPPAYSTFDRNAPLGRQNNNADNDSSRPSLTNTPSTPPPRLSDTQQMRLTEEQRSYSAPLTSFPQSNQQKFVRPQARPFEPVHQEHQQRPQQPATRSLWRWNSPDDVRC